ncbi:MAG: ATP-binding protein, partial [Sphingobacterium sp.]|nr:ATP-binding protein [Sphingobacterium sp.]
MKNFIEILLEEKSKDKTSFILYNQWIYDKALIPQALNSISSIFPHYSLHNVTHSEAIISNIIKIVGQDNLRCFTETDLWLILESAYSHDLGMIVTSDLIKNVIENGEIQNHLVKIQDDPNHDLHEYSLKLTINNNKIEFISNTFSLEKSDVFRYILADYFRSTHGSITTKYLTNPSSIALDTPRTIIPQRLYDILGKVCEAHSKNFQDLFELPFEEDGIDIDVAHPRLIASLLRLGDLLDIDNGRFSKTELKTLNNVPDSTLHHQQKHMSIKHKSINSKKIELIAECEDKYVALITQDWFGWINEEFTNQTLSWNNISPSEYNFNLPTVDKLDVELKGYEKSGLKHGTRFTVDTPKALELLKGANFYETPLKAIRELLQNSIDSTLLRVWEENRQSIKDFKDFLEISKNYPISITLSSNNRGITHFQIDDNGAGISKEDLKYMISAGSSSKNIRKIAKIKEMPIWMQPAGYFGIGFQSSFLLSNLVEISTKSLLTNDRCIIEFHSPDSKYKGNVYLKTETNLKSRIKTGSTINLKIDDKRIFDNLSFTLADSNLSLNYSFAYFGILEELRNIAKFSFFPMIINGEKIERTKFDFVSSSGIEIKFDEARYFCEVLFKNSPIHGFNFKHFKGIINYHAHDSSILNISRRDFRQNSLLSIENEVLSAFQEFIKTRNDDNVYLKIIDFIHCNNKDKNLQYLFDRNFLPFNNLAEGISINKVLNFDTIRFQFNTSYKVLTIFNNEDNELIVECGTLTDNNILLDILIKEVKSSFENVSYTGYRTINEGFITSWQTEVTYSKLPIVNNMTVKEIIQISQNQFTPYKLIYLPDINEYKNLFIKSEVSKDASIIYGRNIDQSYRCILSPLIRVTNDLWIDIDDEAFFNLIKSHLIN